MRIDLHTHTKASTDSWIPPEKLCPIAKMRGLHGVAITDHDATAGWKKAKEGAKKAGINLVLGEEVGVKPAGKRIGEIIGLFMNEEVSGERKTAVEVIDELKAQDAVVVLPHPFDVVRNVFPEEELRELAVKVDAIEVFNSHAMFQEVNTKADAFADEFRLPKCAGSDAHSTFEVGLAYTEAHADDLEEFRKRLLAGKTIVYGRRRPFYLKLMPFFARKRNKYFGRMKF